MDVVFHFAHVSGMRSFFWADFEHACLAIARRHRLLVATSTSSSSMSSEVEEEDEEEEVSRAEIRDDSETRYQRSLGCVHLVNANSFLSSPSHTFLRGRIGSEMIAREIANRSSALRNVFEVLATGETLDDLLSNMAKRPTLFYPTSRRIDELGQVIREEDIDIIDDLRAELMTFKIFFEHTIRLETEDHLPLVEPREFFDRFRMLPFCGSANMKAPDVEYFILQDIRTQRDTSVDPRFLFTRRICESLRTKMTPFSLQHRKYIGTTSMDPELSFIMTNLALVNEGDLVLDPFCGTGGLLLPCAHLGAEVIGCEIDRRVILGEIGYRKGFSIFDNFDQLILPDPLTLLSSDFSVHPWRFSASGLVDAIVTDPPYGVREASLRIGKKSVEAELSRPCPYSSDEILALFRRGEHIPQKVKFELDDLYLHLVEFAARYLRVGGRLVFWQPSVPEFFDPNLDLPMHPCLRVVECDLSQPLAGGRCARWLLVYEKTRDLSEDELIRSLSSSPIAQYGGGEDYVPAHARFREYYWKPPREVVSSASISAPSPSCSSNPTPELDCK